MATRLVQTLALTLALCAGARADIVLHFAVDTSSLVGTTGSFDMQFNPGPLVSQVASLQVLGFAGDGTLAGSPASTGTVSGGPLPGTVTFRNTGVLNDYFEGFTYGTTMTFGVRMYGPAVNTPDGTSTSGSAFAFSLFSDAGGTTPVLTTNTIDGFAVVEQLNLDGSATVTDYSSETSVTTVGTSTPEPASEELLGVGLAVVGIVLRRRRWALPRVVSPPSSGGSWKKKSARPTGLAAGPY